MPAGEELVFATASVRATAVIASLVLGIIALAGGGNPRSLTLVAAVVAGTAILVASTSLSIRFAGALFPRRT